MEKTSAIIVDDEESARNVLFSLLTDYCKSIEVVDSCQDVEEAVISIKKNKPDLVFLDIEMPNYAGFEIVKFFDKIDFEIIFVTAYEHYALKAIQLAAVHYILKPIDIDELKLAVEKFNDKKTRIDAALNYKVLIESLKSETVNNIVVPVLGGQKSISVNDIIAMTASESYTEIHTYGEKFVYSKNLKHFEKLLENNSNFVRTHKSWMVNTHFVQKFSKSAFTIELEGGLVAKLSKLKKAHFEAALASR